jgi:hypothetical protein
MYVSGKFRQKTLILERSGSMVQAKIPYRDNYCVLHPYTLQLIQTNVEWKQKVGLLSLNMCDNDFGINTC